MVSYSSYAPACILLRHHIISQCNATLPYCIVTLHRMTSFARACTRVHKTIPCPPPALLGCTSFHCPKFKTFLAVSYMFLTVSRKIFACLWACDTSPFQVIMKNHVWTFFGLTVFMCLLLYIPIVCAQPEKTVDQWFPKHQDPPKERFLPAVWASPLYIFLKNILSPGGCLVHQKLTLHWKSRISYHLNQLQYFHSEEYDNYQRILRGTENNASERFRCQLLQFLVNRNMNSSVGNCFKAWLSPG